MVKTVFKTGGAPRRPNADFTIEAGAGEYLFREGDLGTEMFIVQDGEIEIVKQIDGQEKEIARLEKGDFFGEMSLLEDLPRNASARVSKDAKLLQINGSTFDQMLRNNPEIAVRMMRKLSRRLREANSQLMQRNVSAAPAPQEPEAADPATQAPQYLIERATATRFHLSSGAETSVGRQDPVTGINPEVDLTDVDTDRSTSRRHAKFHRRGNKFFLTEEIGTTNGTFINGHRVETGVPFEVNVGDEVQFGLVKLEFLDS